MRSSVSMGDWNEGRQRHWCVVASRFLRNPPGAAEASSCGRVSIIVIDYSYHLTGCHPSSKVNKYFFWRIDFLSLEPWSKERKTSDTVPVMCQNDSGDSQTL